MKASLALIAVVTAVAAAAPAAFGMVSCSDRGCAGPGVGPGSIAPQGVTFITDTLGGNGHPRAVPTQGYRFITDTLAPGGGPAAPVGTSSSGFSWADAGVGAGTAAGALFVVLGGFLLVGRRNERLAV